MQEVHRVVLPRRIEVVDTPSGAVRMKVAEMRDGRTKAAPEYQDCKRLADQTGRPIREILEEATSAYRHTQAKRKKPKRTRQQYKT